MSRIKLKIEAVWEAADPRNFYVEDWNKMSNRIDIKAKNINEKSNLVFICRNGFITSYQKFSYLHVV